MTLKDFIWLKQGKVTDSDVAKFLGKEPNFCTVEEYKRQYFSFKHQCNRFTEYTKDNAVIQDGRKRMLGFKTDVNNGHLMTGYIITKDYFNYLKGQGYEVC